MKTVFVLVIALFIGGCVGKSETSVQHGDFKVEFLFEQDGCKMYRFEDGDRYIYWSDCSGKTSSDVTHSNGKGATWTEHNETITSVRPSHPNADTCIIRLCG